MDYRRLEAVVRAHHELFMLTSASTEALVAEHGLTHATAQALWVIDPKEEPPSMKMMSDRLFCNAPNLSFLTGQLIKRKLVEQQVDAEDRRSRVLVLTADGVRIRAAIIAGTLGLSPFAGCDDGELVRLAELLQSAIANGAENSRTSEA